MKKYDVYGIGNALVDTEYEVSDEFLRIASLPKGMMTLIEEQDRHRLIQLLEDKHEHQAVKLASGGSAANTVVAVSQLGGSAFYSCKVANDPAGDFFVRDLDELGVDTNLEARREPGTTGACISMVTPDAERTMTTHLGITQQLSVRELRPDALRNASVLYIEGYLVSSPSGFDAALEAQRIARASGVTVALTLSDPAMVQNFKSSFDQLIGQGVDLLFCNEDEAALWSQTDTRDGAIEKIRSACTRFAMTCGSEGAIVCDGATTKLVAGVPIKPVDTTGAGDNFAGAFLYKVCRNQDYASAAAFANRSASLLVSSFGARLTSAVVNQHLKG
ncbi:MAG: adenosine kinase [Proteobacteria bacterium]|jgi:sugar/nucleoside kinase (ribokinase family)|nr:adenosine kinase [Pseudomonadota bacterium]